MRTLDIHLAPAAGRPWQHYPCTRSCWTVFARTPADSLTHYRSSPTITSDSLGLARPPRMVRANEGPPGSCAAWRASPPAARPGFSGTAFFQRACPDLARPISPPRCSVVLHIIHPASPCWETAASLLATAGNSTFAVGRDERLAPPAESAGRRRSAAVRMSSADQRVPPADDHHVVIQQAGGATTQEASPPARCSSTRSSGREGNYELLRRQSARSSRRLAVRHRAAAAFADRGAVWSHVALRSLPSPAPDAAAPLPRIGGTGGRPAATTAV